MKASKNSRTALMAFVTALLAGCGGNEPTHDFVKMARLHSIEVESVSMIAEERGNDKMLLRVPCSALLGVDLDEVKYDCGKSRLTVKLPPIVVTSPKVFHEKEQVIDERKSIWSSPNVAQELKEKAERRAQKEVEEIAMSQDAVKLAKEQTRRLIECFYRQSCPGMEVVVEWDKN